MRPHFPTLLRELSRGRPLPQALSRASEPAPPASVTVRAAPRAGDGEWDVDVDDDGRAVGDYRFDPCEARGPNGEVIAFSSCLYRDPKPGAWEAFAAWCARFDGDHRDPDFMAECFTTDAQAVDDENTARLDREARDRGDYDCFC